MKYLNLIILFLLGTNSAFGRFINADPLFVKKPEKCVESPKDCGLYNYTRNNPMKYIDPTGGYPMSAEQRRKIKPVPNKDGTVTLNFTYGKNNKRGELSGLKMSDGKVQFTDAFGKNRSLTPAKFLSTYSAAKIDDGGNDRFTIVKDSYAARQNKKTLSNTKDLIKNTISAAISAVKPGGKRDLVKDVAEIVKNATEKTQYFHQHQKLDVREGFSEPIKKLD